MLPLPDYMLAVVNSLHGCLGNYTETVGENITVITWAAISKPFGKATENGASPAIKSGGEREADSIASVASKNT